MLQAINLKKIYPNGTKALEDVSFHVKKGETCSIIGPSGCGKSTLLFIFSCLLKPTSGKILINNMGVKKPFKDGALILQDFGLFPWKTVYENIAVGLRIRGFKKESINSITCSMIKKLGLEGFEHFYPTQLSGGMQQKVGFARVLALNPRILFMDEPFSSLDAISREEMQNFLLNIWLKEKLTILLVTHNIEEAVFLGKKIVVLSPRPARVLNIIENHNAGDINYRNRVEFFEKCREVRNNIKSEVT